MPFNDRDKLDRLDERIRVFVDKAADDSVNRVQKIVSQETQAMTEAINSKLGKLHGKVDGVISDLAKAREKAARLEGYQDHMKSSGSAYGIAGKIIDKLSDWPLATVLIAYAVYLVIALFVNNPGA